MRANPNSSSTLGIYSLALQYRLWKVVKRVYTSDSINLLLFLERLRFGFTLLDDVAASD